MTQIALQVYGRTAFDYAAETTSFIMLHSPLDRLKKREEVCRVLHPLLTRAQKQHRPLTERKAIIIAQVAQFSDPFKCRMMVRAYAGVPCAGHLSLTLSARCIQLGHLLCFPLFLRDTPVLWLL
eukprot:m.388921 g.388921  ORF g.388921 m.388921 type:complete len:124 (-) comp21045_c2_seq29:23-394(-)